MSLGVRPPAAAAAGCCSLAEQLYCWCWHLNSLCQNCWRSLCPDCQNLLCRSCQNSKCCHCQNLLYRNCLNCLCLKCLNCPPACTARTLLWLPDSCLTAPGCSTCSGCWIARLLQLGSCEAYGYLCASAVPVAAAQCPLLLRRCMLPPATSRQSIADQSTDGAYRQHDTACCPVGLLDLPGSEASGRSGLEALVTSWRQQLLVLHEPQQCQFCKCCLLLSDM